jgi:xanthine/uracil permease
MVAFNVWGKGAAKMLCALIGLAVGYLAALSSGLLEKSELTGISAVLSAGWISVAVISAYRHEKPVCVKRR